MAGILNFVDRHISSQNHLRGIVDKFDEDILNHSQAIASGSFSVRRF